MGSHHRIRLPHDRDLPKVAPPSSMRSISAYCIVLCSSLHYSINTPDIATLATTILSSIPVRPQMIPYLYCTQASIDARVIFSLRAHALYIPVTRYVLYACRTYRHHSIPRVFQNTEAKRLPLYAPRKPTISSSCLPIDAWQRFLLNSTHRPQFDRYVRAIAADGVADIPIIDRAPL